MIHETWEREREKKALLVATRNDKRYCPLRNAFLFLSSSKKRTKAPPKYTIIDVIVGNILIEVDKSKPMENILVRKIITHTNRFRQFFRLFVLRSERTHTHTHTNHSEKESNRKNSIYNVYTIWVLLEKKKQHSSHLVTHDLSNYLRLFCIFILVDKSHELFSMRPYECSKLVSKHGIHPTIRVYMCDTESDRDDTSDQDLFTELDGFYSLTQWQCCDWDHIFDSK